MGLESCESGPSIFGAFEAIIFLGRMPEKDMFLFERNPQTVEKLGCIDCRTMWHTRSPKTVKRERMREKIFGHRIDLGPMDRGAGVVHKVHLG